MAIFERFRKVNPPTDRVTAADCKSGFFTVTLYDDEMRVLRTLDRLRDVTASGFTVHAKNEFGLVAIYQAPYFSVEEQP